MQQTSVINRSINKKQYDIFVTMFLLASFFVYGMFRAFELGNGRTLSAVDSSPASAYWGYTIFSAIIAWAIFELIMRLYYFFVSLSIFSFVLPKKRAYVTFRFFYAIRTLLVTGLSFLLFVSPVFVNFLTLFTLIIDMLMFVGMFFVLRANYFKILLAPFAWKAFLRPFLIFETIMLLLQVGGII